jgi:extracellular factor (EF) 3-hydroxypalmitic acid methyl ester biosynthesis protein
MFKCMSHTSNGNGSGNGKVGTISQSKKPLPLTQTASPAMARGMQLNFETADGLKLRAVPLGVTRHTIVFEIYDPNIALRLSQALDSFKITLQERTVYSGRAIIRSIVNAGVKIICEAALHDSWLDVEFPSGAMNKVDLSKQFKQFVGDWQRFYRVNHDYKVVVADVQIFLTDLRLWLDQVEMGIRSSTSNHAQLELEIAKDLFGPVISSLNNMFERFEIVSAKIEPDLQAAHRAFGQRQLHPHLLCSPFIHRTYTKPSGYAGDYEMMNMIVRNRLEGNSLYAKLINAYLLAQIGPQAVRNRVDYLHNKIVDETSRLAREGEKANIYSIACGPAWEAVNFIADHPLADNAEFELLDFDEETLRYTTEKITEAKRKNGRKTHIRIVKNSVQNLLRAKKKSVAKYDLIYCSGLYDYLSDTMAQALNTYLYDLLNPGGLLVVGNFAPNTPVKYFIEHLLEWFLIYRDGKQLAALAPEQASKENCVIRAEPTGTNIFLEVRKPK